MSERKHMAHRQRSTRSQRPTGGLCRRQSEHGPSHHPQLRSLPAPVSSFIGRDDEIVEVAALLASKRLVTLTGPAGGGKTRLALRVAEMVADDFPDGVFWVDMERVSADGHVSLAVAAAVGLRETAGGVLPGQLEDHLAARAALLVFDTCEAHLAAVGALIARLLHHAPALKILAVSRTSLDILGETVWSVPLLRTPPSDLPPQTRLAELLPYDAVRLFIERAQDVCRDLRLDDGDVTALRQIMARLDGLPLAIELAATHLRSLSLRQLVTALDVSLALLETSNRSQSLAQHSLQAAIDGAYSALTADEQGFLRGLSIFPSSFTLDAALSITPAAAVDAAGQRTALQTVAHLVDISLVMVDRRGAEPRYYLLGLVREHGMVWLAAAGEAETLRRRHAAYYLRLAETAAAALREAGQAIWLERLAAERDNFAAAFQTLIVDDGDASLRLAVALGRFWETRGYITEGRQYLTDALQRCPSAPPALRARALEVVGVLEHIAGVYGAAIAAYTEALTLHRQVEDAVGAARCLHSLAVVAKDVGDYRQAAALYDESVTLLRALNDMAGLADALTNLGILAHLQGDYRRSPGFFLESLALYVALEDTRGQAYALSCLGLAARNRGEYDASRRYHEQALALRQALNDRLGIANSLANLGLLAQDQADPATAVPLQIESLALFTEIGHQPGVALLLSTLAVAAIYQGDFAKAYADATQSLALYRDLNNTWGAAMALNVLALATCCLGHLALAHPQAVESLRLRQQINDRHGIAECFETLAVALCQRAPQRALVLVGAADALRAALPAPRSLAEEADLRQRLTPALTALAASAQEAALIQGRQLSLTVAMEQALLPFDYESPAPPVETDLSRAVRQALHHLEDVAYLQRSELARRLGEARGARWTGLALQRVLVQAIEALHGQPGQGGGKRQVYHTLLRLRFVEDRPVADVLRRLAISERQYYRELQDAIGTLADDLLAAELRQQAS